MHLSKINNKDSQQVKRRVIKPIATIDNKNSKHHERDRQKDGKPL